MLYMRLTNIQKTKSHAALVREIANATVDNKSEKVYTSGIRIFPCFIVI